jgi:NADPH:quinone reductase
MKAIRVHVPGGPEVLKLEELPRPEPKPDEVIVRVRAAGVNFLDIYQRSGLYKVALPFIPGMEGAGIVEQGNQLFPSGSRVAWTDHPGAYAEFAAVPCAKLVPIPDEVDFSLAAAVLLQGMTAEYLTESTFPVNATHQVLVHAGAGGVGSLLIQLIKRKNAMAFTTVSNEEKARLAREDGADLVVLYEQRDFPSEVRAATGNAGVHVVYDSVGAATFTGSLESLRPRGMMVLFGQSSGRVSPIDPALLQAKGSLFFTRPSLGHYIADHDELMSRSRKVFDWVAKEELRIRIHRTYSLSQVATAQNDLASRRTTGKLLILLDRE